MNIDRRDCFYVPGSMQEQADAWSDDKFFALAEISCRIDWNRSKLGHPDYDQQVIERDLRYLTALYLQGLTS
jgi:hypothetical protein